jgi:error-prone DNA polymerase
MGFYAPAQIVRDAREHGVVVRDVDVNASDWDCTLEPLNAFEADAAEFHPRHAVMRADVRARCALRLGFRQISGMAEKDMARLVERRGRGYDSVRDLWLRGGLSPAVLEGLAEADAFRSLGLSRRDALWAVRGLNRAGDKDDLPLFQAIESGAREPDADLPPMPLGEEVVEDYRHLALSLRAHPVAFFRERLSARAVLPCGALAQFAAEGSARREAKARGTIAGLVLVRQRPGSAHGVIFLTIEDETGVGNLIVWPKTFERFRPLVIGARFIAVSGVVQNEAGVVHLVAERFEDLSAWLNRLSEAGAGVSALARADEVRRPQTRDKERPRQTPLFDSLPEAPARVMPKGRNFR